MILAAIVVFGFLFGPWITVGIAFLYYLIFPHKKPESTRGVYKGGGGAF